MLSKPFTLWLFKLDNSLSLRGNIEGCYSSFCLFSDYLLYAERCSVGGIYLATHVSGEYARGLVTGATECIRLPLSPGTFGLKILACKDHMAKLGDSWSG